jgi:hypothetical protein
MLLLAPASAQQPQSAPATKMNRTDHVPSSYEGPIALVTYFKAAPGKIEAYSKWMAEVAKPVDDWAAEHGAFESVVTYVNPDPNGEWTHMRIFTFKSREQMNGMAKVMDAAHKAVYPDPQKREEALGHKDDMRTQLSKSDLMEVIR